jgi:hypothetical protein
MGLFDSNDTSAQEYLKQALQAYQSAAVPTIASETVGQLPMETVQGTVNPAAIQVATQAPSAYNNIALDPATRAAQMAALGQYTNIANAGGLDPAAKLALQQTIDAANAQAAGERGALQQQAQAEGQGGGDFALTQEAIANQGASNTAATQGLETAAMAEANREAALNSMASIGGSVNASDYAQQQAKAAAQNTINATNQAATNAANTSNVANTMQAGEFNTNTAQGVNAANTAAGQNRVYYNAALPQQQFNNELNKASGIAGVSTQQAGAAQAAQNAGNAMAGTLIGAGGQIGAAALGAPAVAKSGATTKPANAAHGGVMCYAEGGVAHDHAICMKLGSYVPGKANVEGDSEENDTVPAMLSPGELVIPRSVPKDGESMERFAKNAPVPGTGKTVDLTAFTKTYKRSK